VATTARWVGSHGDRHARNDLDCGEELIQIDTQHPCRDIRRLRRDAQYAGASDLSGV
jgi:hypothetical protein